MGLSLSSYKQRAQFLSCTYSHFYDLMKIGYCFSGIWRQEVQDWAADFAQGIVLCCHELSSDQGLKTTTERGGTRFT